MSLSAKPLLSPERRHRDRRAGLATAALRRALTMPGGAPRGNELAVRSPRARRQLDARRERRLARRRLSEVSGGVLAVVLLACGLLPACSGWPL